VTGFCETGNELKFLYLLNNYQLLKVYSSDELIY